MTVKVPDFKTTIIPGLVLTVGQLAEVDIELGLGETTISVVVVAKEPMIETSTTEESVTITENQLQNLPLNGRGYINFSLLTSQVRTDSAPSIGAAPTSGLNFNGQRARSNQVSVDGFDFVDNSVNGIRSTVSLEAVQEFQLIMSNYMPEYGRATGAVLNIVTKSGSNELHGNAFGFMRHKDIQARNPFSVEVNPATGTT